MFNWVANSSEFSRGQMEILQIDPHCSAAISKCNVSLLIYCRLKTNFIAKSQLLHMGCPLTRERKQKKNPIFILVQKCPRPLTRECPLKEMCKYRV